MSVNINTTGFASAGKEPFVAGGACLYRFVRLDAPREEGSEALMVGIQRSAV